MCYDDVFKKYPRSCFDWIKLIKKKNDTFLVIIHVEYIKLFTQLHLLNMPFNVMDIFNTYDIVHDTDTKLTGGKCISSWSGDLYQILY